MKAVRSLIDGLYKVPGLNKMKPLLDAMDAGMFGTAETTSGSPHIVDNIDIKRYMVLVIVALLPAVAAAVLFFGPRVIAIIMVSYIAGGAVEVIFAIIRKHDIEEGFLITGLIFPLVLPPTIPLWIVAVGVVFGTMFGKEMFGGTGRNIFNPALVGRLFITIAFPAIMTVNWQVPFSDTITSATPLNMYKKTAQAGKVNPAIVEADIGQVLFTSASALKKTTTNPASEFDGVTVYCIGESTYDKASKHDLLKQSKVEKLFSYSDLMIGKQPGSIGETSRILVMLGGVLLIVLKVSNWRTPVSYILSVLVFAAIGSYFIPEKIAPPALQLLTGGLLFGAFFMSTDPVTSPFTSAGIIISGVFCGLLTVLIRSFSGYVEGVMFSIVIMNAFAPLIDQIVLRFKYRPVKT